jgi:DNA segregation ATPase FtsK/SpoIIIE and related proteins
MLFYLGYASYYFALILSYFGIVLFVSSTSSSFFERINLFNRFMLSLISIFPLAVFYASFFNDIGGIAGESLLNSMGTYLNKFWLGSLSIIIFLSFQYLVFYDFIKFINLLNNQKQTKSKKVPDKKPIVKEVKKTEAVKKTETKKPSVSEPIIEIQEQKDFLDLLDQKIDESADITKEYLEDLSNNLVIKLEEFGIEGKVEGSFPGPVITRFEINLAPGTKASQVTNIANDLARSLAVKSVRVVEVIEGKSSITSLESFPAHWTGRRFTRSSPT